MERRERRERVEKTKEGCFWEAYKPIYGCPRDEWGEGGQADIKQETRKDTECSTINAISFAQQRQQQIQGELSEHTPLLTTEVLQRSSCKEEVLCIAP